MSKAEKSQILDVLLTGPRDPRYGSDNIAKVIVYATRETRYCHLARKFEDLKIHSELPNVA